MPPASATKEFPFEVAEHVNITPKTLFMGEVGVDYKETLVATGGIDPYKWTTVQTDLPPGLTLDKYTGIISGNPTKDGKFTFTVEVKDSLAPKRASDSKVFTIVVVPHVVITTQALPGGEADVPYSQTTLQADGGVVPYTGWTVKGSLPPGLQLAPSGTIYGTPTAAGTFTFTVEVNDSLAPSSAKDSRNFTIVVKLHIVNPGYVRDAYGYLQLPLGVQYWPYAETLHATGSGRTLTWTWDLAPPGLTLGVNSGLISGVPTAASLFRFKVTVRDGSLPESTANTEKYALEILEF